jgi:hypothetical protein
VFHTVEISQHAVRRYIERVLELDLDWPAKRGYSDGKVVAWARETHGLDIHQTQRDMAREVSSLLPDTVRIRGSRAVLRGVSCRYVVEGGNCLITVLDNRSLKDARDVAKARYARDGWELDAARANREMCQ